MSLFSDMTTEGMEQSQDRLGGYQPLESGIYQATIKNFYAGESKNGAMSLTLIAEVGDKEYRETIYITNKNKENFFINKKSGKKSPLPGFIVVNDICLIVTGKELHELETEEKVVKIYDYDAKEEVPKSVPVITEALDKPVALGIIKQIVNKNEKVGDKYVPTAESREENLIDKVFHPEYKLTVAEARDGKEKPDFWDAWLKRNEGVTRDRRELKDGESGGKVATPPKAGALASKPRKSLFGK